MPATTLIGVVGSAAPSAAPMNTDTACTSATVSDVATTSPAGLEGQGPPVEDTAVDTTAAPTDTYPTDSDGQVIDPNVGPSTTTAGLITVPPPTVSTTLGSTTTIPTTTTTPATTTTTTTTPG